ncbi:MAG: class I SAM-dependent methyltransferase [Candidatus Dadabacteria bacterium]|nr:class I SAM-dependent methyltransferase [Candidatus Dadabacteria bacterium]
MNSNKTQDVSNATYTMGYSDDFQKLLRRRNAQTSATHLLPHLEPGMRVLDFGCGPGTISVGLAKAVEPGELFGVDMEASQIEIAQAAAEAGGHRNATFQTADVTDLPFEDNSFDVAHCHAVLMHAPDTVAVLTEVRRVLKPGGIISSREMFVDSSFLEPSMRDGWETFAKLIGANGGHPQIGRELKRLFIESGFRDISASVSFEPFSAAEDIDFLHGFIAAWFFSPPTVSAATMYGIATREQFDGWRRELDEWKDTPGALAAFAWGEAIGRK